MHLAPIVIAIVMRSWLPILLFSLPRLYGGVLIWTLVLAQHSGLAEDILDYRLNTRTIRLNPVVSFLYMHMEYHTEHHIYPNIPFHSLAQFRSIIDDQMPFCIQRIVENLQRTDPCPLEAKAQPELFHKADASPRVVTARPVFGKPQDHPGSISLILELFACLSYCF